jgi:phosphoribosylformylglycinamidine synthase
MVLAVPPESVNEVLEICAIEEVEASLLGAFTDDHRLIVTYHGQTVADMDMAFLHEGRPDRVLKAVWQRNAPDGGAHFIAPETVWEDAPINTTHYAPTLLALLRHPTIASKEAIVRRYDHEVQGATILKPLVGRTGHGPSDAAVLQPLLDEERPAGVILSNGINPLYGKIDPYHMAVNAIDEALRNLTAVGGDMTRAAILDNFCWGNPTDPAQLGMLVRAAKGCHDASVGFKVPFISGKDSLNNEYRSDGQRFPVIPTLLISAVGVLDDAAQTIDMPLKTPGNLLYQIGMTRNELAGSHYAEVVDAASFERLFSSTAVPQVHLARAATTMKALGEAIRQGLVRACHDLSEGGLAVAAAEMALAGMLGVTLDVHQIQPAGSPLIQDAVEIIRLFSESASRFLVEVTPEQWGAFEKHMRTRGVQDVIFVGTVTNTGQFIVRDADIELIHVNLEELQEAFLTDYLSSRTWKGGQR